MFSIPTFNPFVAVDFYKTGHKFMSKWGLHVHRIDRFHCLFYYNMNGLRKLWICEYYLLVLHIIFKICNHYYDTNGQHEAISFIEIFRTDFNWKLVRIKFYASNIHHECRKSDWSILSRLDFSISILNHHIFLNYSDTFVFNSSNK